MAWHFWINIKSSFENVEDDPDFNLDKKVVTAAYPGIKADLPGVDIDLYPHHPDDPVPL